ncbi:CAP domain-containing protein [Mesobacillus harenae]|uniref:CAP domain-containing protein n=1 Tax=Mesobacillus harenae TaxID=2213203 RepID=UPI001580F313|nr:CAP domain-containing protein [Mesobacillus harenae]
MKKKFILSIAATAALLVASPGANEADAASNYQPEKKVYFYQSSNANFEQLNSFLQKYFKGYTFNWNNLNKQTESAPVQQPVQQPADPVQQPQQTQPEQPAAPVQQQPAPVQEKPAEAAPVASQVSAFEQKVVELTNQERSKQGLSALKLDTELSKVAKAKSLDMKNKNYFSHTSPTYGSPFDMMKQFGISYRTAGENIAMGQRSPEEVVTAWMNSEGHRKNIMNGAYTHIGVGHVADGNYWTQMFIGK